MARKRGGRRAVRGLAGVSFDALQRELARRHRLAGALERRRARVAAKLEAIDRQIASYGGGAAPAARRGGRRRGGGPGRPRAGNSATLAQALAGVLSGKTMGVSEVADAVKAAGYKTNSPNFRTIVNAALINHKSLFRKKGRGKYTAR
jgi:hypothetical protein